MTADDHTAEDQVRHAIERADELVKYAPNRPDPAKAYEAAGLVLDEATSRVATVADEPRREALLVQLLRRRDDLAVLMRDQSSGHTAARAPAPTVPAGPTPLPQPGPETRDPPRRDGDDRVPPGQHLVRSWPVLHTGRVPATDLRTWSFTCRGLVRGHRLVWSWRQFQALPRSTLTTDFHCVTGWSRLDNRWEGVRARDVAAAAGVRPEATHAVVYGANAYSANVDLPSLLADDVIFAWSHDGQPLSPEHGAPLRLVLPARYAWKSVKWVSGVQFLDHDVAGYWEARGYHNVADPFLEQRYA